MAPPIRVAFIGNSLPRRCGIATFTNDLQQAVAASRPDVETAVVAMTDHGQTYEYPPVVRVQMTADVARALAERLTSAAAQAEPGE